MRVLILGGTQFIGRHLVSELLRRGHEVVLFNRGRTNPELFPQLEQYHGDRRTDLALLPPSGWDAVVDTCAYVPRDVEISTRHFASSARQYVFISTVSVFDLKQPQINEQSRKLRLPPDADRDVMTPETYGALKALCEDVVAETFRRATIVRPGLVAGPWDPTDRFSYWPLRVALGGDMLAPAPPDRFVQYIDARDLATFTALQIEKCESGDFNVVIPPKRNTLGEVLGASMVQSNSRPEITWVEERFLEAQGVQPWTELPLWIPQSEGAPGITNVDMAKAFGAGLTFRPMETTIGDILHWQYAERRGVPLRAGLAPAREKELLAAWASSTAKT